ncbi:MAG: hypothetical protein R3279_07520 [Putridiphycobacter sp.]|nr:hypothetical protein [Putridiphycobacter sp.]
MTRKVKQLKKMPADQLFDEAKKRKATVEANKCEVDRINKELEEARKELIRSKIRLNYAVHWLKVYYEIE